jgi:hypothetical protein
MNDLDNSAKNLAKNLVGEFSNQQQAIADPAWYVHLRLWHVPVAQLNQSLEGIAIFAEQANVINIDKPYRQRMLSIQECIPQSQDQTQNQIQVKYYAFKSPATWIGGGANPERLAKMEFSDLDFLPGCTLPVAIANQKYSAQLPTDAKCCFIYNNQERQVILGFESTATEFWSYDRGIDPDTKAAIWGAIAGAYHYQKLHDFSFDN